MNEFLLSVIASCGLICVMFLISIWIRSFNIEKQIEINKQFDRENGETIERLQLSIAVLEQKLKITGVDNAQLKATIQKLQIERDENENDFDTLRDCVHDICAAKLRCRNSKGSAPSFLNSACSSSSDFNCVNPVLDRRASGTYPLNCSVFRTTAGGDAFRGRVRTGPSSTGSINPNGVHHDTDAGHP